MRLGTVFRWNDFPYRNAGGVKPRWFIFLGRTGHFTSPVIFYISTATTQLHHYKPSGNRAGHLVYRFLKGEFGFAEECIVDFSQDPYDIEGYTIENHKKDIEVRGVLTEDVLLRMYRLISESRYIPKRKKLDIYECFCKAGISGLAKPVA